MSPYRVTYADGIATIHYPTFPVLTIPVKEATRILREIVSMDKAGQKPVT